MAIRKRPVRSCSLLGIDGVAIRTRSDDSPSQGIPSYLRLDGGFSSRPRRGAWAANDGPYFRTTNWTSVLDQAFWSFQGFPS